MKLSLIVSAIAVSSMPWQLSAHAGNASIMVHKSPSAIYLLALIGREVLPLPPHSSRLGFHLATQSSCDAAQAQCVAACNNQGGTAQQNCISDCNDVRSTCQ